MNSQDAEETIKEIVVPPPPKRVLASKEVGVKLDLLKKRKPNVLIES